MKAIYKIIIILFAVFTLDNIAYSQRVLKDGLNKYVDPSVAGFMAVLFHYPILCGYVCIGLFVTSSVTWGLCKLFLGFVSIFIAKKADETYEKTKENNFLYRTTKNFKDNIEKYLL